MKGDPGVNFTLDDDGYPALSRSAATIHTESIDHSLAPSVSYFISCGTFATSFVATLQYSDDDSTWTIEATGAGNDLSSTLTTASNDTIHVPNPRGRYSRLSITTGGICVFGVTSVLGPLRSVAAE